MTDRCTCKTATEYWAEYDRKQEEEKRLEAERKYQKKLNEMILYSNLGERFRTRTFDNYNITKKNLEAVHTAKKYVNNFLEYYQEGTGLLFTGSYGTGKTHLAAAITLELLKKDYHVVFGTLISLLGMIKKSYNEDSKVDEDAIMRKYISADLLVVDDLGKERPSEWVLEKLYTVINTRYENNKPTVITSNYDIDKLEQRLTIGNNEETAKAIISRINEVCVPVEMIFEDYRRAI